MSGIKDIAKGGWHPKGKDGKSKESWRGDFKGINQVAGWMGKSKATSSDAQEHISRPLSTLKDPAAFGPPPKNVNYHGGAALPNQIKPDSRGLGAPLPNQEVLAKQDADERGAQTAKEEAVISKGPSVPYRADTTGLLTSHLPPPPTRKDGGIEKTADSSPAARSKLPTLPPRLPPRQTPQPLSPSSSTRAKENPHKGTMNQDSLGRRGVAGIAVPVFGIDHKTEAAPSSSLATLPAQSSTMSQPPQLSEVQSHFSRLASNPSTSNPSSEGTTFAEKQAALRTASSFRKDPSSVSFVDAKAAAGTANNFRERHGEQMKSGWQSASRLSTKYGIADTFGGSGIAEQHDTISSDNSALGGPNPAVQPGYMAKKRPPPPPIKRVDLSAGGVQRDPNAPPIPISSKPKPNVSTGLQ